MCYIGNSQMDLTSGPFPITQSRWGIAVNFAPIREPYLEQLRNSQVKFNFQMQVYILSKCRLPTCSLFHGYVGDVHGEGHGHIGDKFLTPTLLLSSGI